jgi:hypothetical protein
MEKNVNANPLTCERCGSGVPAGASTCPNCGAPVGAAAYETRKVDAGWSEMELPQPAEPPEPAYEPTVKVSEPPTPEPVYIPSASTPAPLSAAPKRSRVWQIVVGCVALVVICCCLAVTAIIVAAIAAGGVVNWQMGTF